MECSNLVFVFSECLESVVDSFENRAQAFLGALKSSLFSSLGFIVPNINPANTDNGHGSIQPHGSQLLLIVLTVSSALEKKDLLFISV
jgi:hypothetical protein